MNLSHNLKPFPDPSDASILASLPVYQNVRLHTGDLPDNFYQELKMNGPYVDAHYAVSDSSAHIQLHSHAFSELVCCGNTHGVEYLVGTERYKLQRGDVIFIPPDISHCPLIPENAAEPYSRDMLWISKDFIHLVQGFFPDAFPDGFADPILFRTAGTRWEFIRDMFQHTIREAENKAQNWDLAVVSNTLSIFIQLRRAQCDLSAKPMKAEKPELLDQLLMYIEQHLSEKITLAEISRFFYVSESTITQTFRRKMGISFYRCVTQRRLTAAKGLIERGLPLDDVAEQVGFSDYSSFFRAFKQEYGFSPRQYRKQYHTAENK